MPCMCAMLISVVVLVLHQAYTMELEAEVAKLKEENDELRKKQVCVHPL